MRLCRGSTGFAQFKVQSSLTKVRATQGSMTRRLCRGSTGLWPGSRFSDLKVQSDLKVDDKVQGSRSERPKVDDKVKGNLLLLTSSILLLFRTTPVPFNLEGAPPLSCILPPQGEENRSACRSYIKVSADHQRSGFFCALRQGRRAKAEG